jgi:hypothetical protein
MICRPRQHRSNDDPPAIFRLSGNALDQKALEVFLHNHLWIVEEELRMCLGRPPWFDFALCFVLTGIVRDLSGYRPQKVSVPRWMREKARQVGTRLERTLAKRHVKNGLITFTEAETFPSLLGSLLERHRPPYWEELRRPKSLGPRRGTLGDSL